MKELIEFIVKSLCDKPDEVVVTSEKDGNSEIIKIFVEKNDMGKVIGRNGKIASSIRTIAKSLSNKKQKKIIKKKKEKI